VKTFAALAKKKNPGPENIIPLDEDNFTDL